MNKKTLTLSDFEEAFGEKLSPRVAQKIAAAGLEVTPLSPSERDSVLLAIIKTLLDPNIERVGAHRIAKWEKGWGDNLAALKEGKGEALVPYYFKNDAIARWRGEFIRPSAPGFDYKSLEIILEWIYELYGLDWAEASQGIISEMVSQGKITNVEGKRFDFFNPDASFALADESIAYTVAALEQVGENHEKFIEYLLGQPGLSMAVHVEPVAELLDSNNLLDYLSIEYFRRRNYLWGFLTNLRRLEAEGKIKIHRAQRTNIGGTMFVEHYQVIAWSPVKRA